MKMLRSVALLIAATIPFASGAHGHSKTGDQEAKDDYPVSDVSALGAASVAKEVCSAVFVSGRDAETFLAGSSKFWMLPEDKDGLGVTVDRDRSAVTLTLAKGTRAQAVFAGEAGCIALGPSQIQPSHVGAPLPPVEPNQEEKWPMGDLVETSASVDEATLSRAGVLAFAEDAHTLAFLVLHKGNLIYERYADGIDAETRLPGWSITKTLQAAIAGRMEQQGLLSLYEPISLPEWNELDDPRRHTTLADLLRMSAPISCGNGDPQFDYTAWRSHGYPFYLYTFSGPQDAYSYSVSRPPLEAGKPRGYYANCQPHVTGHLLKTTLAERGETLRSWANTNLFAPLGATSFVLEEDRAGNPLTAGYSLATARDWARLGLLYANEGVWGGERLFSKEFMSLTRAAAPYWEEPIYGGQVWLRPGSSAEECAPWPCDTYSMNGIEGQRVMIVPSRDLVVVRLGEGVGDAPSPDPDRVRPALVALDAAAAALVPALPDTRHPEADEVYAGLRRFFEALGMKDRAAFDNAVTDDFTLFEVGEVWSGDRIFNLIADSSDWSRRWTLTQPKVSVSGDQATIIYRNALRASRGDEVRVKEWLESATLKKGNDGWIVAFLHSTEIPQIRE